MNYIKHNLGILIIISISLIILARIFHPGFIEVHDDTQPARIVEMTKSLKDGLFPVRWVDDLGFGYGYPIFNFYAPFPYYTGAVFNLIGLDAFDSAKIMFIIPVLVSGIGMYLFIRSILGVLPGIGAGVVYLLFPYFAVNIFIRGAVGEYFAYALLPYILWGFFKIYYITKSAKISHLNIAGLKGILNLRYIIISTIALTLLIISHNLSAYILFLILIFFFMGTFILGKNRKVLIINYSIILIFSFLFSSFYTLPALFEMKFTDVNSQLAGNFNFANHFVCPYQWWDSPWGFGGSAKGCSDGFSFRLGKTNIVFAVLGIIFGLYIFFKQKKKNYSLLFFYTVFILIFSLFMMTDISRGIWEVLPSIKFLQFPWRFLNLTGFAIAVLSGFFIYYTSLLKNKLTIFSLILVLIGSIILNLKLFTPQFYSKRGVAFYTEKKQMNFTISKITNEYMPQKFNRPVNINQIPESLLQIYKGTGQIKKLQHNTQLLTAELTMNDDGIVRINKAYFPAWILKIDNKSAEITKTTNGMTFVLPKGTHNITLQFIQTPVEELSNILTLSGVFIFIIGIIFIYGKKIT